DLDLENSLCVPGLPRCADLTLGLEFLRGGAFGLCLVSVDLDRWLKAAGPIDGVDLPLVVALDGVALALHYFALDLLLIINIHIQSNNSSAAYKKLISINQFLRFI
ncbi:hypothetical protein, partial [Comamonas odontotermitis]|uniref:hypothetical protein n=1 Tax=Comamonas odontotermitis TaxID=379895 RepID=UPI0037501EFA